jgi:hypothetical protein
MRIKYVDLSIRQIIKHAGGEKLITSMTSNLAYAALMRAQVQVSNAAVRKFKNVDVEVIEVSTSDISDWCDSNCRYEEGQ